MPATDALVSLGYPAEHRRQIWSNNPLDRLNHKINRPRMSSVSSRARKRQLKTSKVRKYARFGACFNNEKLVVNHLSLSSLQCLDAMRDFSGMLKSERGLLNRALKVCHESKIRYTEIASTDNDFHQRQ
jgi:hypothetical protein